MLICWLGADSARAARQQFLARGIPSYDTPNDAIRAFMQRWRHQRNQLALMETPPDVPELFSADLATARQLIQTVLAAGRRELTAEENRVLLAAYGIALASKQRDSCTAFPVGPLTSTIRMVHDPFGPALQFGPGGSAAAFSPTSSPWRCHRSICCWRGKPSRTLRLAGNCKTRCPPTPDGWMVLPWCWSRSRNWWPIWAK